MPVERIAMRDVREIVRLRMASLSTRQVGIRVRVTASTVRLTLKRLQAAGLDGPGALAIPEAALEGRLFEGAAGKRPSHRRVNEPDWAQIRRELQRKHVTLSILWDEYIAEHPDGYRYSRFCGSCPIALCRIGYVIALSGWVGRVYQSAAAGSLIMG